MPDEPEYDENGEEITPPENTQALRDARAAASRHEKRANDADRLERENTFLKALPGADMTTPKAARFMRGFDGDLDIDAIRDAATEDGIWAPTTVPPNDEPGSGEPDPADLQRTRDALRSGQTTPPQTQADIDAAAASAEHPADAGFKEFRKATEEGGMSREDASAQVFDRIIDAANQGDKRVLWTKEKQREEAAMHGVTDF